MRLVSASLPLLLLVLLAPLSSAGPRHEPSRARHAPSRNCVRCAPTPCRGCTPGPAAAPAEPGLWDEIVSGFELNVGFRWQDELECGAPPRPCAPPPPPRREVKDPFYLGAGVRVPLSPAASGFVNFDRDWTEAPHYQIRLGLAWRPFGRPPRR